MVTACGDGPSTAEPEGQPKGAAAPHILLLSIDTLRADHLGCYGYGRDTSPHLDGLAAQGVRYHRALAPTPWTLPSHGALLSGVDPYLLGLTAQWRQIPPQAPMLAEALRQRGYRTAAFVDSTPRGFVGGQRGFDRGFDLFRHAPHGAVATPRYDIADTVDAALAWLDGRPLGDGSSAPSGQAESDRPFFLFLHSRSVHAIPSDEPCRDARCSPYFAPPPWGDRFLPQSLPEADWDNGDGRRGQDYLWWLNEEIAAGRRPSPALATPRLQELIALYDGAIAYTDHHIGRLLDGLEARGLRQGTWIVVTSDHGEAFLEHRLVMHQEVFEPTLRVPLLVAPPQGRRAGEVVMESVALETVALEDVAVTLRAAASAPLPPMLTGRPLPLLGQERTNPVTTESDSAPRYFFSYYLFPEKFDYRAFAIEGEGYKLVLHNPQTDQLEHQLMTIDGATGEARWVEAEREDGDEPPNSALSAAVQQRLRQRLKERVQRTPMAEVDDPAHLGSGSTAEALSTLGYID